LDPLAKRKRERFLTAQIHAGSKHDLHPLLQMSMRVQKLAHPSKNGSPLGQKMGEPSAYVPPRKIASDLASSSVNFGIKWLMATSGAYCPLVLYPIEKQ
jgi:hypothetical protein